MDGNEHDQEAEANKGRPPKQLEHEKDDQDDLQRPRPQVVEVRGGHLYPGSVGAHQVHHLPRGELLSGDAAESEGLFVDERRAGRAQLESRLHGDGKVTVHRDRVDHLEGKYEEAEADPEPRDRTPHARSQALQVCDDELEDEGRCEATNVANELQDPGKAEGHAKHVKIRPEQNPSCEGQAGLARVPSPAEPVLEARSGERCTERRDVLRLQRTPVPEAQQRREPGDERPRKNPCISVGASGLASLHAGPFGGAPSNENVLRSGHSDTTPAY